MRDIIMILSGIFGGCLFVLIKNKVFKSVKQEVIRNIPEEEKKQMINLYQKGLMTLETLKKTGLDVAKELNIKTPETFNISKFTDGMTNITSKVGWAKDIASIFSLRKLIIVGVIISCIFGFGYYKGQMGKPVNFDLKGKEATIQLNEHFLKIEKDGTAKVVDKDGKILKTIKVKDIDGLRQSLRPYGFKLDPIFVAGASGGLSGSGFEAGVGVSWFKYFKNSLDSFITNRGLYPLAASYSITDNSGVGLGAGVGYELDKRVILYYKWRF